MELDQRVCRQHNAREMRLQRSFRLLSVLQGEVISQLDKYQPVAPPCYCSEALLSLNFGGEHILGCSK